MAKVKALMQESLDISERYRVELKVYETGISKKYPGGCFGKGSKASS